MNSLYEANQYRDYLSWVLAERMLKNRRYSLRAFAKSLGVSAAHLSCLLKGKRRLSSDKALDIAKRLHLGAAETEYFLDLVRLEGARSEETRTFLREQRKEKQKGQTTYRMLPEREFDILDAWYLIPLIALCDVPEVRTDVASMANRLGISTKEATVAVAQLVERGYLQKHADGSFSRSSENLLLKSEFRNARLRQFHRWMLSKAVHSLYEQDPKERISRTETLAINPSRLEEAKALTRQFMADLVKLTSSDAELSEVYHFAFHGFSLTKRVGNVAGAKA